MLGFSLYFITITAVAYRARFVEEPTSTPIYEHHLKFIMFRLYAS